MSPDRNFWAGKKVLVTGHTGFKGAWLSLWLKSLGARVMGLALPPATDPSLFDLLSIGKSVESTFLDIRSRSQLAEALVASNAEIVFHLAAQAFVREGYRNPMGTFETNFDGTRNLLEALRHCPTVKVAVIVTTDKVYRNLEQDQAFGEDDPLGGHDPYSASKAASELLVECYRESFLGSRGLAIATARAGNVIGGGDWSPDRLIPDCVRAWSAGNSVDIRMPDAVRPWQHVLDPLAGYLKLAHRLWLQPQLGGSYNFGPDAEGAAKVRDVVTLAREKWGAAKAKVKFHEVNQGPKESKTLRLNNAKARAALGVRPVWALAAAMDHTIGWYRDLAQVPATELCARDIAAFERDLQ